jgi:FtsZ-binding cell division protein ZapB
MTNTIKIISLAALLMLVAGTFSCNKTSVEMVTKASYDALLAELNDAQAKITELENKQVQPTVNVEAQLLQDEIDSLHDQINNLGQKINDLIDQNNKLTDDNTDLQNQYDNLQANYQLLQQKMNNLEQLKNFTEEQVENEILSLINDERIATGIPAYNFGYNLYNQAKQNSRYMEQIGKEASTPAVYYTEVFWAVGYDSAASAARGAVLTWKLNEYRFEHGALLPSNNYGAVGAIKSGDVIYITFMAANYP